MLVIIPFAYVILQTETTGPTGITWEDTDIKIPGKVCMRGVRPNHIDMCFVADDGKSTHEIVLWESCVSRFVVRNNLDQDLFYIDCGTGSEFILHTTIEE